MFITVSRAAHILHTAEATVRALERRGELPAIRTASGVRLFELDAVQRLAAARAEARAERARLEAEDDG